MWRRHCDDEPVSTPTEPSSDQRNRLRRAHERLRTASSELQALVATEPIKGRWAPEPAPPVILQAARDALRDAYAGLAAEEVLILGSDAVPADGVTLDVVDAGRPLSFAFSDLMRHHGPGSPGGVAHAFKVLELVLPLLDSGTPPERREIRVATAFGGPGARDGFELVTRAVTGDRFVLDPDLARPELGAARERFVFVVTYRERRVTLTLREDIVTDAFIALVRKERSSEEDAELEVLKREMADRVMATAAADVYEATVDA